MSLIVCARPAFFALRSVTVLFSVVTASVFACTLELTPGCLRLSPGLLRHLLPARPAMPSPAWRPCRRSAASGCRSGPAGSASARAARESPARSRSRHVAFFLTTLLWVVFFGCAVVLVCACIDTVPNTSIAAIAACSCFVMGPLKIEQNIGDHRQAGLMALIACCLVPLRVDASQSNVNRTQICRSIHILLT